MTDLTKASSENEINLFEKPFDFENKSDAFNLDMSDSSAVDKYLSDNEKKEGPQIKQSINENDNSYRFKRNYGAGMPAFPMGKNQLPYKAMSWVDEIFLNRQKRLNQTGINNAQDYVRLLTDIDEALEQNPQAVIKSLCEAYGLSVPPMSKKTSAQQVQLFQSQRDENGCLKYPFFEAVRPLMADLLQKGLADDLSGAYQKAIWLDEGARSHLIADYLKSELNRKAVAAQQAKKASFSPHSKSVSSPKAEKTLREEIEEIYYNLL